MQLLLHNVNFRLTESKHSVWVVMNSKDWRPSQQFTDVILEISLKICMEKPLWRMPRKCVRRNTDLVTRLLC